MVELDEVKRDCTALRDKLTEDEVAGRFG